MLTHVDAVVTTPSTAMLEGMLQQLPVALLDYNNCPHYVPAAWRITAAAHFDQVIPELVTPPPAKRQYQQFLLHDALECATPALPRLVELIHRMHAVTKKSIADGRALAFPPRLLQIAGDPAAATAAKLDYRHLFPANGTFGEYDLRRLQAEIADLRAALAALKHARERNRVGQRLRRLRQKAGRMVRRLMSPADDSNDTKSAA